MKETINNLKFYWKYAKDQKWRLIGYVLLEIIFIGVSIALPIVSAQIIISLTEGLLEQVILTAIAIYLLETFCTLGYNGISLLAQKMYRGTYSNLQIDIGTKMLQLHNEVLDENSSGVFIQRMTGDSSKIADVFYDITNNISNIITNLGVYAAVFILSKKVFLFLVVSMLVVYVIEYRRMSIRTKNDKIFRKENEKLTGFIGEIVRGARDIKMLNAEKSFIGEMKKKIVSTNDFKYKMNSTDRKYQVARGATIDLQQLLLNIFLVYLIKYEGMAAATALIIHNYSGRVEYLVNFISQFLEKMKDFNLSTSRVAEIIEGKKFKKEKFGKRKESKIRGDFEFIDVDFAYKNNKVLSGLNFKVHANETVAFVGKSGAGKSTIFSLLCRMYDPSKGRITIDGTDIKKLDKDSIRGNITIINQNPYIFNVSIKDNLRLVKENATDEEIEEACRLACLDEFIQALPDKYDTLVGEGGVSLSGGQKQRLAIARALVQKTKIILFDEATSALDNITQNRIQQAIDNMKEDYTILIIAHRLSTIVNADRILFLDEGHIVAEGTHQELLKQNQEYKKLYESEITK